MALQSSINSRSLNTCTVQQPRAILSRLHMLFHFACVLALLYYRVSNLVSGSVPALSWGLITFSELLLTFTVILQQSFRWRPVARTVAPDNLPGDDKLPGVDVLICTADPVKEPLVDVMNTVVSAMALDYPAEKLAVYLSDDAGSASTLAAMKEAGSFARSWIPFCRKFGVRCLSPEAFFSPFGDDDRQLLLENNEYKTEEQIIQSKYEDFKRHVEKAAATGDAITNDRPPYVEVIYDTKFNQGVDSISRLPLLVYVSREKRPSYPHHFKAGALNSLLRVSGIMSNAPYVLVLDCDMHCNDATSAKQAMCFHLDPQLSDDLSYVQFPQIFYNVSKKDIYDSQARPAYKTLYQGMDGLRGAICGGTGYFLKKKSLYCRPNHEDEFLDDPEKNFGFSRKLIDSVRGVMTGNYVYNHEEPYIISDATIVEAKKLATCTFEHNTRWGKEIGYSYDSLLESTFTGYVLHCKGWRSVYLYPKRPCFLGCTTIDMNDALLQLMKWASGLVLVGLSKFCPLTYGVSRMSIPQSMCYGFFSFVHFQSISCLIYGILHPLCFVYGIPLYPEVTSPWFLVFATVFLSSLAQHSYEVISSGDSMSTMWNEQRVWMIKSITACLFGCLDAIMKYIGVAKASLSVTNKAIDEEKLDKYKKGKFNFDGAKMFMVPLITLMMLNLVCFVGGVKELISRGNVGEMFGQGFLSLYVLVLSYPILEGLVQKIYK